MNLLSLEGVAKGYGDQPLFHGVDLHLQEGERVGLIGVNGSGKSTLLKVIAGELPPDEGRVSVARERVVTLLPQDPMHAPGQTVMEAVFAGNSRVLGERLRTLRDYEQACRDLEAAGDQDEPCLRRVSALQHEVEASGAWDLDQAARAMLAELGLPDRDARMGTLSGGQQKRIALAHALLVRPDLLILDEPTNHLDPEVVEWLEEYLERYAGALLLVTHDRYFLDRVTRRILELDRGSLRSYQGNYADYLEQKQQERDTASTQAQKLKKMARRELEWLRRGPPARTTKASYRVEQAHGLIQAAKDAKAAAAAPRELDLEFTGARLGKRILELTGVGMGYGDRRLFDGLDLSLRHGDRVGIIGANGSGKTTLLKILAGRLTPDRGTLVQGQTVVVGYFDQVGEDLDEEQSVLEAVEAIAERIGTADGGMLTASQMLDRFLFPPGMQRNPVGTLSGGERRRLHLLRMLMGGPNLLLLDEVTNDLDIPTMMALEEYLEAFPGCVVAVSHDRYFLDRTVRRVLRVEGDGRVREYPGHYTDFRAIQQAEQEQARQEERQREAAERAAKGRQRPAAPAKSDAPARLSYKERQELLSLETRIHEGEARQQELEAALLAESADYRRAQELGDQLKAVTAQLERDMERWTELAERD